MEGVLGPCPVAEDLGVCWEGPGGAELLNPVRGWGWIWVFLGSWEPLAEPEMAWPWSVELVTEWDSAESAERGLPVGPRELEGPARGSAGESVEGSVPGVRPFLLDGSVPGLEGCLTCPSAMSGLRPWLLRLLRPELDR